MTVDRIVVDVVGLGLIGFIVWFFWLVKKKGVRAPTTSGGYQEQMVLVKGGYTPDVIVVEAGKPVRLNFVRQESASCSELGLRNHSGGEIDAGVARRCADETR